MANDNDQLLRKASKAIGESLAKEVLVERVEAAIRREKIVAEQLGQAVSRDASVGVLVAEGDSWFDYPGRDVLKTLHDDYGYDIEHEARSGDCVEEMAYSKGQLVDFTRCLQKVLSSGKEPAAILISGGGNDIAGDEFAILLNHASSGLNGLNTKIASGVMERLVNAYITILTSVTTVCEELAKKKIQIILHGYDYPVPDGRGYLGGLGKLPGPWLDPGFRKKGYPDRTPDDRKRRIDLMSEVINLYNNALIAMTATPEFAHVKFIDLRGTLSTEQPSEYKEWWSNELHPTRRGFSAVTQKVANAIKAK